jgi:hypothetical protein
MVSREKHLSNRSIGSWVFCDRDRGLIFETEKNQPTAWLSNRSAVLFIIKPLIPKRYINDSFPLLA